MTESNEIEGLTERQRKAIPFLIDSKSHAEGCKRARISRKTFYQWLKDPVFKDAMKRQRDDVIEDALDSLKGSMAEAVTALRTLLDNTENDGLRRYVAKDIIDYIMKAREHEDLEKRISAIEAVLQERRS